MPIRNPFKRGTVLTGSDPLHDERGRSDSQQGIREDGEERDGSRARPSMSLNIKERSNEPNEYKMSGMLLSYPSRGRNKNGEVDLLPIDRVTSCEK
jgi:hypothetical protein